jgi:hypothetical protein
MKDVEIFTKKRTDDGDVEMMIAFNQKYPGIRNFEDWRINAIPNMKELYMDPLPSDDKRIREKWTQDEKKPQAEKKVTDVNSVDEFNTYIAVNNVYNFYKNELDEGERRSDLLQVDFQNSMEMIAITVDHSEQQLVTMKKSYDEAEKQTKDVLALANQSGFMNIINRGDLTEQDISTIKDMIGTDGIDIRANSKKLNSLGEIPTQALREAAMKTLSRANSGEKRPSSLDEVRNKVGTPDPYASAAAWQKPHRWGVAASALPPRAQKIERELPPLASTDHLKISADELLLGGGSSGPMDSEDTTLY